MPDSSQVVDSPKVVWHYTTSDRVRQIIFSGEIPPGAFGCLSVDIPLTCFSTVGPPCPDSTEWGRIDRVAQGPPALFPPGFYRIAVPSDCAPYDVRHLHDIVGSDADAYTKDLCSACHLGSDPSVWRFATQAVSARAFLGVDSLDLQTGRWKPLDIASLGRRR
jgi:hypothetical protein